MAALLVLGDEPLGVVVAVGELLVGRLQLLELALQLGLVLVELAALIGELLLVLSDESGAYVLLVADGLLELLLGARHLALQRLALGQPGLERLVALDEHVHVGGEARQVLALLARPLTHLVRVEPALGRLRLQAHAVLGHVRGQVVEVAHVYDLIGALLQTGLRLLGARVPRSARLLVAAARCFHVH